MGWDQLIRHIKNCSLPYFLPELAELALVTDMCFLLGRHRPLLLTHHPGYLACPSLFTTSPHSFHSVLASQTHILSWNTREENISFAWWGEGGRVACWEWLRKVACWEWLMAATWVPISQQTRNTRDGPHSVGIYVRATEKIYVRAPVKIGGVILVTTRPSSKWQLSNTWIVNGWQH